MEEVFPCLSQEREADETAWAEEQTLIACPVHACLRHWQLLHTAGILHDEKTPTTLTDHVFLWTQGNQHTFK